jgi:hypothetical protein
MIEAFDTDPFQCPHCKKTLELVGIWHADYGWIYHYMDDMEIIKKERRWNGKERREIQRKGKQPETDIFGKFKDMEDFLGLNEKEHM